MGPAGTAVSIGEAAAAAVLEEVVGTSTHLRGTVVAAAPLGMAAGTFVLIWGPGTVA